MPAKSTKPFPLQMEVEFLDRLSEPVREGRAASVSAIIRSALEYFDLAIMVVMHPAQLQISVRLPVETSRKLRRASRARHISVGRLVRAAVEAYLPSLEAAPAPKAVRARKKAAPRKRRPARG
jgi:predicted DNA-binding protein